MFLLNLYCLTFNWEPNNNPLQCQRETLEPPDTPGTTQQASKTHVYMDLVHATLHILQWKYVQPCPAARSHHPNTTHTFPYGGTYRHPTLFIDPVPHRPKFPLKHCQVTVICLTSNKAS